jgi:hypothetical protein
MARHKGNLAGAIAGVLALKKLQDGDQVLISRKAVPTTASATTSAR